MYTGRFGATRPDGSSRATELQEVAVKAVSKERCVEANPYSYSKSYINFDHVVCTGGVAGKDACNGDSGGPAIFFKGSEAWLVGVLSKGSQLPSYTSNCAVEGRYGMYTLVHYYGAWIYATIHGQPYECKSCPCTGSAICNQGYTGANGGACFACPTGTYKDVSGTAGCTSCPDNANAPEGSTTATACACNQGYTGANGGACTITATDVWISSPPATSVATHVVKLSLSLAITKDDFDDAKQAKFMESIARAAGASPADVAIDNIEALSSVRRQLLALGVRIDVSVKAKNKAAADAMGASLTVGNINDELSKTGLPQAQVLVKPTTTAVSSDPAPTVSGGSTSDGGGGIPSLPIIGGAVGVVLIGIAVVWWWRRQQTSNPGVCCVCGERARVCGRGIVRV